MTLTEFLLARFAEDEARALALSRSNSMPQGMAVRKHLRLNVADCEAKRRMVTHLTDMKWVGSYAVRDVLLGDMALPYADHPDYEEGWKP